MTDVFVVAILVALVQFGGLLLIRPGAAAMAFGGRRDRYHACRGAVRPSAHLGPARGGKRWLRHALP